MALTKTLEVDSAISILSLGSSLKRKERLLWKKIERETWGSDPNYVPSPFTKRKNEEREFFVLRRGEKAIGRAAATIDQQWISKNEDVGFIDDFVINPEDKDCASILIEHCLSALKGKGVSKVMVRSYHFPGLAEKNEELPPFGLPYTPQWYINLFEKTGFLKYKEWQSLRMSMPHISREETKKGDEFIQSLGLKLKPLNVLSQREVKGYNKLLISTLGDHFSYHPRAIKTSLLGRIRAWFLLKLTRFRVYVSQERWGEIVAYYSFHPDYNVVLKRLSKAGRLKVLNPRLLLSLHGVKRAVVGSGGHAKAVKGKGVWNVTWGLHLDRMRKEGYAELDTGRFSSDNISVAKSVERFYAEYGGRFTTYYTLVYKF
jgi:hypothetical protein